MSFYARFGRGKSVRGRAAIDAAGHPALLAVDAIASLGCDPLKMDDWGIDVLVAASQKGLMTPPGLAFVWFSDRAREVTRGADLRTPYWDWGPRATPSQYYQYFAGTAPTHHIYGLAEALKMLVHEEGLPAAWARHATLARAVRWIAPTLARRVEPDYEPETGPLARRAARLDAVDALLKEATR